MPVRRPFKAPSAETRAPAAREVVVVVDDDDAVTRALKFSMELEGYRVLTFADAESLLARRRLPRPACLVIDAKLPGLSGMDLLDRLRARGVSAPATLITTNPPPAMRARAAAAGAPIVEKPLLRDELIDTVKRMASRSCRAEPAK